MHKFALFPLIPGMIENSDLESLHRQMLAKGINYVTFASGSKGASISSNGKPDQIYSKDGQFIEDIKFTPNQIRVEYVKKSSSTNSYFKKVVTYPTQKRGLLLNHLYEQGFAKKGLGPVATAYQDAVAEYSNIVRLELLDEIEYTYNPETNTYTGNHTKFVDLINRTLEERDVPKHLLETITTDLKGNLSNDLSYHISADKIEKLLTSLIEKRLIKQNVVGEPLIQMPSSMFNGIWDTSPEIVDSKDPRVKALLGTNNLAFYQRGVYDKASKTYGKTAAMHISIALQGPFKNLLKAQYKGEEIGTIDRLNEAIKDQQWFEENQSLVTIVGDRIPIQDHGSLEFARIWHFLPESMTNVVVVPTEIVAKAGSDFDVDKIFWQFPEINKEGKLFESTLTDTEISELMVKDPVAGKKALAEKKKSVNNKLIQANIDILSHPDIYAYLIKPNNTYLWEDIAKELEVYYEDEYNRFNNYSGEPQTQLIVKGKTQRAISPSKTLEPLYQAHKLGVNMVGKDGLGVVALANKIHPILVSVGARMNAKHYEFDSKSLTYTGIEHPLNLMFDYNKTEDGAISLSYEYNSDKNKIADLHSHLMNGLVDVEKDAWVFYVRANIEQLPVLLHLSEAGVNQEVIAKFLTQPLLRQYITQSGQISGMYYELKRENEKIKKWEIFGKLFEQTGGEVFTERVLLEANKRRLLDAAKLANDTEAISLIETASELTKLPKINHNGYTFNFNRNIGNKNLLPYVEQILMEEVNVTKFTNKNLTNNLKEPNPVFDLLALTHYLKAEYQSKDYHEAKQMFNPDTKVSKTATASYSRAEAFNEALKNPNIHKDTLRRLKEESVLKSFFNNDIAINLLKPMFALRLNSKLLDYVLKMQSIKSFQIRNRFNNSKDYKDLFNSSYSNAVISYIWQNSMSYMLDENGRRTSLPKVYGSFDIVINNSISEVTALEGSKLFVNTNKLNEVFSSLTVSDPKAPVKDKETFAKKEIFPNVELLTKFYLELAVQRTMYPNKSKQELIKRALIFSFNPHAMLIDGYSKKIMELVQQNKLQTKFSVLNLLQIAEYPSKKGFSVLTLADNRNINGDLATEFASQLSQLADETVSKVSNKALNYEISEYFKIFSEVLFYQHGSGYSMNGINNVLNVKKITELLDAFGNTFINTELSKEDPAVLDEILKNVLSFDPIHNYTNIKATPLEPIIETEEPEESTQSFTSVKRKTYSGKVTSLQPNQIFVFGSNPEGRHGAGAAKYAKDNFGAVYGQGEGLQGQSYALPTKDLRIKTNNSLRSISAEDITENIKKLYEVARQNPTKEFLVSDYSESNLNGYSGQEMADMFTAAGPIPSNIVFNENFDKLVATTQPTVEPVGEVKEGVSELFESNPELANIGTPEQYSQYLESIFPDSQVKDIVYHGSGEKIEQFKDEFKATQNATIFDSPEYDKLGFFFTTDKNAADTVYAWKFDEQGNGTKTQNINPSVVNVSNPQKTKFVTDLLDAKNIDKTKDGYIAEESSEDYYIETTTEDGFTRELKPYEVIIVPKSEQIHILGTKQDIEGFKEFVDKESLIEPEITLEDQNNEEDVPGCTTPF
jgi:hypothetical protein